MLFIYLQALIEHHDCSLSVLFISVGVVSDFVVKISVKPFLLISCSSFASQFFNDQLLVLSCSFDLFSGFLIWIQIELASFLEMNLVKQEMGFNGLFEFFICQIFLIKYRVVEKSLSSFKSFELDTEFGQIQDQIRSVEFFDIVFVEFCGFFIIVSEGI
jgi:hypothetical protein